MIVKLLVEHHLEFLSLKGGCRGWSESTLVKMSNCWKSHALAQLKDLSSREEAEYSAELQTLLETGEWILNVCTEKLKLHANSQKQKQNKDWCTITHANVSKCVRMGRRPI